MPFLAALLVAEEKVDGPVIGDLSPATSAGRLLWFPTNGGSMKASVSTLRRSIMYVIWILR